MIYSHFQYCFAIHGDLTTRIYLNAKETKKIGQAVGIWEVARSHLTSIEYTASRTQRQTSIDQSNHFWHHQVLLQ